MGITAVMIGLLAAAEKAFREGFHRGAKDSKRAAE
jgi:hypothetical protein